MTERGPALPATPRMAPSASASDVLRIIRSQGAATRADLVRSTGLSRATLGQRLDLLLDRKLVVAETAASTGGRPPGQFLFNPGAGIVAGVDLGATQASVAVGDLAGTPLASRQLDLAIADGPDAVLGRVLGVLDELLAGTGRRRDEVCATGIGLPGPVDFSTGRPVRPPIMPGWNDFDVRRWFGDHIPGPVLVDNDVNVMALGEYWRSWSGSVEDLLYVKVGTGIGAGVISRGEIFRGANGAAGDIGHVRVDGGEGTICDCGNEGCLEAVAAGRALARQLAGLGHDVATTRDVIELVTAGNPDAVRAVRAAGRRLGEALAAAVNLLNPAVIVVGGDLVEAHDQLLVGVREVVYQRSTALATQRLRIAESALGADAGIAGCMVLAVEGLFATGAIDELLAGPTAAEATA